MLEKTRRWLAAHPYWALALVTVAALAPFLAKPFNMDDPMFVWTAQHIQQHPANPYGFSQNWYGTALPMWENLWDPPLTCYFLAGAAAILGWNEIGLHLAFLLPALAVVLGTYRLAGHFCCRPMLAALAALLTPVFLVSSTTVMCDVPMLAFWVWAVVLWVEGMERDSFPRLAGAGLLMALAALTKHFGVSLIPLLAVHGIISQRRSGRWAVSLLIPLGVLLAYQGATAALYGHGLFMNAGSHVAFFTDAGNSSILITTLTALDFTGGCLAVAAFFAPLLWRPKVLAAFGAAAIAMAVPLFAGGSFFGKYSLIQEHRLTVEIQIVFWAMGGVSVLALAVVDVFSRRDPASWLLALWAAGTFLFAAFLNWDVNGRALLPMVPATAILLARRLDRMAPVNGKAWPTGAAVCLAAGAALALLVARSDFILATAVRESARQTWDKYGQRGRTLWFEGHWGFQYYLEKLGASALDLAASPLKIGDYLAQPANNTNLVPPKPEAVALQETLVVPKGRWLATMDEAAGAGFYASVRGPLPFVFGVVPPERVIVFTLDSLPPPVSNSSAPANPPGR